MKELFTLFLIFMIYSVIGYLAEISYCSFIHKKIILNRGFLLGPYLPIYGIGAMIIVYLLKSYENDYLALFVMSIVVCSLVEYFVSYLIEKIFKVRFWDYSDKKLNINGRVCLENALLFGIGSIFLVKFIHPIISQLILSFSDITLFIVGGILLTVFLLDFILSVFTMVELKLNINNFQKRDATEEVKQKIYSVLSKKGFFIGRVLNAFPSTIENSIQFQQLGEFIDYLKKETKKIGEELEK